MSTTFHSKHFKANFPEHDGRWQINGVLCDLGLSPNFSQLDSLKVPFQKHP